MRRLTVFLIFTVCAIGTGSLLSPSPAWCNIQFEEVSQQAGITRIGESWGNAWGDFDGDGYLDLWATNHRDKPSLYRNNGDGTFTNIIDEVWAQNPAIRRGGEIWFADTHGVAWADFDNDNDQDLILLSGSGGGRRSETNPIYHNRFYVNENGLLLERADELGTAFPMLRGRTPLWLDCDKDGKLDILLTGRLRADLEASIASTLFVQTGHHFTDGGHFCGFQFQKDAEFAQLSDLTGDGNLELIVHSGPYPGAIYDTAVTPFKELTSTLNFPQQTVVTDAVFADFNGDLLPDVFLARNAIGSSINQVDANTLKINIRNNNGEKGISFKADGKVRFEIFSVWEPRLSLIDIGAQGHKVTEFEDSEFTGADPIRNVGIFKFVLSPDDERTHGLKDRPEFDLFGIYVGYDAGTQTWTLLYHKRSHTNNWTGFEAIVSSETKISEVSPIHFSSFDLFIPDSVLLINTGSGFHKASASGGYNEFLAGRSVTTGDFDNDMDLDLYLVRLSSVGNLPNQLYENQGDGTFRELNGAGGASGSERGKGHSVTMADYDLDGHLDLFVTNGYSGYPFNQGPDQLFRNIGTGNNWLQIDLEGTVSNRDGIGARILATTPDGKTQLRENGGGIHWCQQDQKRIHFGLAQNEKVSELVIHWPSGIMQRLHDVPANQVLRVVEAETAAIPGDVNQDGQVNILDFASVVKHFGETPPTEARTDVNGDGTVNILDLVWMLNATKPKK